MEQVCIHYEPESRTYVSYAIPLADTSGTLRQHFDDAPHFALVTVRCSDWQIGRQEVLANPHVGVERAKGIRVAAWLVGLKTDAVLLREDVHGKGPAYVFADAGVEMRLTQATALTQALVEQRE